MRKPSLIILAGVCLSAQIVFSQVVDIVADGARGMGVLAEVGEVVESHGHTGRIGKVVTALHVVSGAQKITVKYRDTKTGLDSTNCPVLASDDKNDIAVLRVFVPVDVRPAKVALSPVLAGEDIAYHRLNSVLESKASRPTTEAKIFSDSVVRNGDSGGPVMNGRGELVGIISGGWFYFGNDGRPMTWPTRAANLGPIRRLLGR